MRFLIDWTSQSGQALTELAPWLLLGLVIAGILHVVLPLGYVRRRLGRRGVGSVVRAALFGVPLPLCSCGVVPAAIGLKRDGASDGASVAFLISTPQTGVDSFLISARFLGWPFALFKVGSALVTGVVGGLLTNRLGGESPVPPPAPTNGDLRGGFRERVVETFRFSFGRLLGDIHRWLIAGIVVAGLISAALGGDRVLDRLPWTQGIGGMLVMLVVSLPMYVCAVASVPIAAALVAGGLPTGAALVFLMAGPASNIATLGAIARAFGRRATVVYLATVAVGSVGLGMLYEAVFGALDVATLHGSHGAASALSVVAAIVLAALLLGHALWPLLTRPRRQAAPGEATVTLRVTGMTCHNCADHVRRALAAVAGVVSADVDLKAGQAAVRGKGLDPEALAAAVNEAGYRASLACAECAAD